MEVDSGSSSSSEDEDQVVEDQYIHTATVRLAMDDEKTAEIVSDAVKVDKEPSRSGAVRIMRVDGKFVVIEIRSRDPKSLSKSIANAVDMCDLSQKTYRFSQKFKKAANGNSKKRPFPEEHEA